MLKNDGHMPGSETLSTFNLALSLRSAAPRIEAHYQYYATAMEPLVTDSQCENWVLLEGQQFCTPALDSSVKEGLTSSYVASPTRGFQA